MSKCEERKFDFYIADRFSLSGICYVISSMLRLQPTPQPQNDFTVAFTASP